VTFADRIKEVRKKLGMTQTDLANELGLTQNSILKYEKALSSPTTENIVKIARLGGVSADWLITGETIYTPIQQVDTDEFCYIPRYDVRAAAGHGALNHSEEIIQRMAFRKEFLKRNLGSQEGSLFVITAEGDSMLPVIHTGDILLCDKGRVNSIREGVFIVRIGNTLLVKNAQVLPGNQFELYSTNKQYKPLIVDVDNSDIEIIAQVVWIGKTII